MKISIAILFAIMCIAQWFMPAKMIYQSEHIIESGTLYKFRTQPVDPSDPFRGKYIVLNFIEDNVRDSSSEEWESGQKAFVTFKSNESGLAEADKIFSTPPATGDYLSTTVVYAESGTITKVHYKIPFDRMYLEESKAQAAEEQYRISQRDSTSVTYGLVRIGQGQAVLVDVMINGKPIVDVVRELN